MENIWRKKASVFNRVEIIAKNLVENFELLENSSLRMKIFPVLKANAYGHGLEECVKILESKKPIYLAVDSYYEALRIRKISSLSILIISPSHLDNVKNILRKKFTLAITNFTLLKKIISLNKKCKVHLMFNTGMNREGFVERDILEIINLLSKNNKIKIEGIFSHFADADGKTDNFTKKQEKKFSKILDIFTENKIYFRWIHLGNSAGFSKIRDKRINAFRPGLALYGFNPLRENDFNFQKLSKLKPILRFITTVTDLQKLQVDDCVSYNCTFKANKKIITAVLPVGYYELFDRRLSNLGFVKYQQTFLPILGRVCMNLTIVDTKNLKLKVGDEIIALSEIPTDKNSVENIAKSINTIPYEVLTRINNIHRRIIVENYEN